MTPDQLAKNGVPLSRAKSHFGDPAKVEELKRLRETVNWGNGALVFLEAMKTQDEDKAKEYGELVERAQNLEGDIDRNFFQGIRTGRLKAFGYQVPRSIDDVPREVPKDLWWCKVSWGKSEIEGNGLKMSGVLVVRVDPALPSPKLEAPNKIVPKKQGRPSNRELIKPVIEELVQQGKIDFSISMAAHYEILKEALVSRYPANFPQGRGLGKEVLRQELSPFFDDHKSGQKL